MSQGVGPRDLAFWTATKGPGDALGSGWGYLLGVHIGPGKWEKGMSQTDKYLLSPMHCSKAQGLFSRSFCVLREQAFWVMCSQWSGNLQIECTTKHHIFPLFACFFSSSPSPGLALTYKLSASKSLPRALLSGRPGQVRKKNLQLMWDNKGGKTSYLPLVLPCWGEAYFPPKCHNSWIKGKSLPPVVVNLILQVG